YCTPRFDSPAVLCRLLDAGRGGFFRVAPNGAHTTSRRYVGRTNVLETTFVVPERGRMRLTDFMPVPRSPAEWRRERRDGHRLLRLVECISGEVDVDVEWRPTFDYARAETAIEIGPNGAVARAGKEALALGFAAALSLESSGSVTG